MKVIIVDDEPKAIQLLEGYADLFSELEVVATFRSAPKALEYLRLHPVDLVLLDINMPNLNGLSLSRMITPPTRVIFTTAYSEYAVESYEINAADYLLKPIGFERFAQAISRLLSASPTDELPEAPHEKATHAVVQLKSGSRIYPVATDQILYLKKDGNYMHYYTGGASIMARETTSEALAQLPSHFIQIHKSYIINVRKIDYYDSRQVVINKQKLPIGPQYKDAFVRALR